MIEDPGARERAALQSYERYLRAYALSHDFFLGVDAATMSALAGRTREGRALAREVLDCCRKRGPDAPEITGCAPRWASCRFCSANAMNPWVVCQGVRDGRQRYGDLASVRRQRKLLSDGLPRWRPKRFACCACRGSLFSRGTCSTVPNGRWSGSRRGWCPPSIGKTAGAHRAGHGARQRLCERADRGAVVCRRPPGFRMRLPRADGAGQGLRPRRALSPAARARGRVAAGAGAAVNYFSLLAHP